MELLKQQIQALIFCSEQSISLDEIASSLKLSFDWDVTDQEILSAIEELKQQFASEDFSFELAEISEGYQFLTKKQYFPAVSALIQHKAKKKLSVSQMETLAIIAYRQPISKTEVEHIRGVSCDYAVHKLLEKELVEISGKSDGPGRPVLYSTSRSFMDYFGIKSVKDLPQLKDLHVDQNEIGTPTDAMNDEGDPVSAPMELHFEQESDLHAEKDEIEIEASLDEIIVEDVRDIEESRVELGSEEDGASGLNVNLSDSETVVFVNPEIEEIETVEMVEEDDFSDDFPAEELPDRKSIFIENELKNKINQEENNSKSE